MKLHDHLDMEPTSEAELTHLFWQFAEDVLPVFDVLEWTWTEKVTARRIVETLRMLWEEIKKSPKTDMMGTGGLYIEREGEDRHVYCFGLNIHATYFQHPFPECKS